MQSVGGIFASYKDGERGAALVGATGAVVGTAMEHAMANGLPKDEWLVYEDALRRGKTVLIALPNDEAQAAAAREVLGDGGAPPALS
jgi:outer membrane lipoprotein SlyB